LLIPGGSLLKKGRREQDLRHGRRRTGRVARADGVVRRPRQIQPDGCSLASRRPARWVRHRRQPQPPVPPLGLMEARLILDAASVEQPAGGDGYEEGEAEEWRQRNKVTR